MGSDGSEAFRRWHELRAFMNTLSLPQWPGESAGADAIAKALCDVSFFRSLELPPAEQGQLLEEAFVRARSPHTQAHVHKARGDLRRFRDDLDGAEADYARALDLYTAVQSNLGLAHVHRARGDLRVRRDDLDGAEADYARALDLY
ncbi:MAG TPA: hypothetical protein PKU97_20260, partial [Kofleriaceae bacterium]|nr:hypothetical protein [Kofleriaceae bacterium]